MKKAFSIVSILMVFMMIVSLAACGTQNINGTYKMTGLYRNGEDYSDKLSSYTDENIPTLVINDKEAVTTMDGVTDTFVIDYQAKTMTSKGVVIPFTVSGNKITLGTDDSRKMIFEKTKQ
ncbi:MAG: hypothetical protein IIZ32_04845 [Ruminococcus sp.]|nr:hypothetical protein [Ruminococcus sp.]